MVSHIVSQSDNRTKFYKWVVRWCERKQKYENKVLQNKIPRKSFRLLSFIINTTVTFCFRTNTAPSQFRFTQLPKQLRKSSFNVNINPMNPKSFISKPTSMPGKLRWIPGFLDFFRNWFVALKILTDHETIFIFKLFIY